LRFQRKHPGSTFRIHLDSSSDHNRRIETSEFTRLNGVWSVAQSDGPLSFQHANRDFDVFCCRPMWSSPSNYIEFDRWYPKNYPDLISDCMRYVIWDIKFCLFLTMRMDSQTDRTDFFLCEPHPGNRKIFFGDLRKPILATPFAALTSTTLTKFKTKRSKPSLQPSCRRWCSAVSSNFKSITINWTIEKRGKHCQKSFWVSKSGFTFVTDCKT
jgi:hypothetical protein